MNNKYTSLNNRYLINNKLLLFFLKVIDFISIALRKNNKKIIANEPRSILISNIAHMGDVLIAKSIIGPLKIAYPNSKIGFIVGSWSRNLVENDPLIDKVYFLDHWFLDRSKSYKLLKFFRYLINRSRLLKVLKSEKYDMAIDTYYFFPNCIYLFWRLNIPTRVGYGTGGYSNFLTHCCTWDPGLDHVADYSKRLLTEVGVPEDLLKEGRPYIHRSDIKPVNYENYLVFHIGSSAPNREWAFDNWSELIKLCAGLNKKIFFTGLGEREGGLIARLVTQDYAVNLYNKLSWHEYIDLLSKASLVVGMESLACHVAAALNTPYIVIKTGTTNHQWRPFGDSGIVLTDKLDCYPCFRSRGCLEMSCINNIEPIKVFNNIKNILCL